MQHRGRIGIVGIVVGIFATAGAALGQYNFNTLATFVGTNGENPTNPMVMDSAGDLFGTSAGSSGQGNVFEVAAGTHLLTNVVSFNGTNGSGPNGEMVSDSVGNLYGTTQFGGTGPGTVFELAAETRAFSTIAQFDLTNGSEPISNLVFDSSGNIYGTTYQGGDGNSGELFEITAGTHTLLPLLSFDSLNGNGTGPGNLIIDSAGNLYGTTSGGTGTVFKIAAVTHAYSLLGTFATNNASPSGMLMDSKGNLFGVTNGGGPVNQGTFWEIPANTTTVNTLVNFNGTDGGNPAGLIQDAKGNFFGVTPNGGFYEKGTVFEITAGNYQLSSIVTFSQTTGEYPTAGLIEDSAGNFYGTTWEGGDFGLDSNLGGGTVFEVSPVPEPASAALMGIGGLALLARPRGRNRMRGSKFS